MDIDREFRIFIKERLGALQYDRLSTKYSNRYQMTFLAAMSTAYFPENILISIEEFLANLSFERASEYVNFSAAGEMHLLFYCVDINLINHIAKYISCVNTCNTFGSSALMHACINSNLNIINFLLDQGANVNAKNNSGQTALMWLSINCENCEVAEQIIELLIFRGADPLIESHGGHTAWDRITNKFMLSDRSQQLLQGTIKMNNTKRAR